jgi:uncharacterized protein
MPALRRRLLRPETWLAGILLLAVLCAADAMRPPQSQVSVRAFTAGVAVYHRWLHPLTEKYVRCRFRPTCSAYAVQAVKEYGIAKGGWMSLRRVARCRQSVPMGTWDPVPQGR